MSDRELFKILKELKLFSTFYLACAQAFSSNDYYHYHPRQSLKDYIEHAKKLMEKQNLKDAYIDGIKNRWNIGPIIKLI